MHLASLCIGVFLFSLSVVIDGAIVEGKKTSGESQRQSTRIGRKLLGTADYPTFPVVPPTAFKCNPANPGYFADTEGLCQVFHLCQIDGRHDSFLCPNGTLFNQKHFVCDWWYNVDCAAAPSLYVLNEVFRQPQQLSGREHANVRPHSVNAFVNPEASIQSYDVPSTISPASPSINRPQHAVTATIARKHSPTVGQQQQHPTTQFVSADTYGSRMPGVNRMGGLDTVLHQNQIINRDKDESTTPVTNTQVLIELTEASPTTESFNEDEFGAHLKSQLGVDEQLTIIPVTTNAAFSSQNNHVIGTAFLTLPNTDDSSNSFVVKTGDKLEASSDGAIESVQTLLTDDNQLNEDELSTFEPNLADVQTSAVVVTFDSLPDVKDLDDEYTTTPLTSPTTDLAAHLLQVVAANATQESTTEDMASINKVNNAAAAAVDLSESNFVTGLEATTFPSVSFDDVLFQTLPEVKTTTAPALIEPAPIIEGLNFNVIADVKPLDLETKDITAATVGPVDIQVFASAFAESSSGADDVDSVSNISSQLALTTEAISESSTVSSTDATPELSTTVASAKGDDVIASPLIANSPDAKKTLYEKLKPVIVGDGRPNIPAIYGRKIPRTGSKITKFSIV
ncbi:hypothetical protein GHT06_011702 [Daphnia sinensis]|uniref:Chitin-binding type-2 domain-containing protein n=1 Tax=Daphnia sinensis TaxID=1820382 RepID=A0AAD5LF15_9CRUS|nr:hypothetical protein GHT06_011702 [Daphnia sinensis]